FCINEGSGDRVELNGHPYWFCSVAEKLSAPFRLRVRGRSGHAAIPGIADNALVKAAPMISALGAYKPKRSIGPEVAEMFRTVTGSEPTSPDDVLETVRSIKPLLGDLVEPLLSMTLTPTLINASQKR